MKTNEATTHEAELTLLSRVMDLTEVSPEVTERLTPGAFADQRHALIWRAICEERGDGHDLIPDAAVIHRLTQRGAIGSAGGADYIREIAALVFERTTYGIDRAIDEIERAAKLRQVAGLARAVTEAAESGSPSSTSALLSLSTALASVEATRKRSTVDAYQALTASGLRDVFAKGIRTGTPVDSSMPMAPGRMYVIGARPGEGKTTLALQLTVAALDKDRDARALFASCEMTETELALKALCCLDQRDLISPLRDSFETAEADVLNAAAMHAGILSRLAIKPSRSIDDITAEASRLHRAAPLAMVVVDYLSAMDPPAGRYDTHAREVGAVSRECKALAQRLGSVVIAVSQINRAGRDAPNMAHLKDSGDVEQNADGILLIHSKPADDDDEASAKLIIAKNRWGHRGIIDLVPRLDLHQFSFLSYHEGP